MVPPGGSITPYRTENHAQGNLRPGTATQHDGAAFRPMFSDVEVHVIQNAGHWVHVDQPAALVAHVQAALARDARRANRTEIQTQETA